MVADSSARSTKGGSVTTRENQGRNLSPLKQRGPHSRPNPARSSTAHLPAVCRRTPSDESHAGSGQRNQPSRPRGVRAVLTPPPLEHPHLPSRQESCCESGCHHLCHTPTDVRSV